MFVLEDLKFRGGYQKTTGPMLSVSEKTMKVSEMVIAFFKRENSLIDDPATKIQITIKKAQGLSEDPYFIRLTSYKTDTSYRISNGGYCNITEKLRKTAGLNLKAGKFKVSTPIDINGKLWCRVLTSTGESFSEAVGSALEGKTA